MGNVCTRKKRDVRPDEAGRVIRAADAFCTDLRMQRRTEEQGRYIRRTGKWSFSVVEVEPTAEDKLAGDRRLRLELFAEPIDKVKGVHWKWLEGQHLMAYTAHAVHHNFNCFLYKTTGSIREHISGKRMALGRDREAVIARYLPDILAGLRNLGCLGLHHTALSWDAIEIGLDGRIRIGNLEYLVDRRNVSHHDLADIRHLPPESLKMCCGARKKHPDFSKLDTWIIGSLLIEILLHKHVSGHGFAMNRTAPSRRSAGRSIKENVPRLPLFLDASSLSPQIQDLIKSMLCINIAGRINLDQALRQCSSGSAIRSPSKGSKGHSRRIRKAGGGGGGGGGGSPSVNQGPTRSNEKPGSAPREGPLEDEHRQESPVVGEREKETGEKSSQKCTSCKEASDKGTIKQEEDEQQNTNENKQDMHEVNNSDNLYYQEGGEEKHHNIGNKDNNPIVTEPDDQRSESGAMVALQQPAERMDKDQNMLEFSDAEHPGTARVVINIKFQSGNKTPDHMVTTRPLQIEGVRNDDVMADNTYAKTPPTPRILSVGRAAIFSPTSEQLKGEPASDMYEMPIGGDVSYVKTNSSKMPQPPSGEGQSPIPIRAVSSYPSSLNDYSGVKSPAPSSFQKNEIHL